MATHRNPSNPSTAFKYVSRYLWYDFNSSIVSGMQNLSISCALVCLIILGSAALVGAFGVCQRQISAILITGVMYLLAGKSNFKGVERVIFHI